MSIRVHNDGIAATGTSQTIPAGNAGQSGSSSQAGSAANGATDQVDISSLSGNIAASSSALASQQAARVSQLAALYNKGEYHVDSMQLSKALISSAIGGGKVEQDS